jgi:Ca-activated chloride channel family protein
MSAVVVVVWVAAVVVAAQVGRGSLAGTITDTGGAALPGVAVTLTGAERRTAVTSERGEFAFENLPAGVYELRTDLAGFTTTIQTVTVRSARVVRVRVQMAIGALTERVTITGQADGIATRRAEPAPAAVAPVIQLGVGVGAPGGLAGATYLPGRFSGPPDTEAYDHITENGLRHVATDPLSTFSIDVDTASYANVRRFLAEGTLPPAGAVRIEELINYFRFEYAEPPAGAPFSVTTELAACPWNPGHRLALIGIQGVRPADEDPAPRNLVFLIDVSGSMMPADKLPLVRTAMRMLVDVLTPRDRVAIVVYAGASGLVLPSTPGSHKALIRRAIAGLEAGGSTNGAAGIQLAYNVAREHFIPGGVNRVVLATDGDFNVGVTSQDELVRLIERERASGVFLSVLGVGTGNLKDSTMEKLADKGNGNYAYLDSLHEARKVLVREAGGTLTTIAKDVKIQIEFNPNAVAAYRLIGYENRVLQHEDFNNDRKDAGDIGSGHSVTALYEIVPAGATVDAPAVDPLKYQRPLEPVRGADASELATVRIRYKAPDGETSRLISTVLSNRARAMSPNLGFASAVAEFGMLLRDSDYRGNASYAAVLARGRDFRGADPEGYRAEFLKLVDMAAALRTAGRDRIGR